MTDKDIGDILKISRVRQSLSQREIAERIGLNQSWISKIERGEAPISQRVLDRLNEWGVPEDDQTRIRIAIANRVEPRRGISRDNVRAVVRMMRSAHP